MLIYLKTITAKEHLREFLKELCKEHDIDYITTRFGHSINLFGTDNYYLIKCDKNKSGIFPEGSMYIYSYTYVECVKPEAKKDKITTYLVDSGLADPEEIEQKINDYGIWYYTDGETYWIGPDDSEATSFEHRMAMDDMKCRQVIITGQVILEEK